MSHRILTLEEIQAEEKRKQEKAKAHYDRRQEFLAELLGPADVSRFAPPPVSDFDAQLGEHAAQLAKIARLATSYALDDDQTLKHQITVINAVTRLIQTNVAIARVLRGKSKTVQSVQQGEGPQAVGSPT